MRTSWPPTKQAVLSYSLRSAFVWEINFSLRVHIFIRGPTAARGRVVQQEEKKIQRGGGGQPRGRYNVVTSFNDFNSYGPKWHKHEQRIYWVRTTIRQESYFIRRVKGVINQLRVPSTHLRPHKQRSVKMSRWMREEESYSSFVPFHCYVTRVVTPTQEPSLVWKFSS